jgi:8-oxo-dGTP pyrophosphatase MutT (NUDIX family)
MTDSRARTATFGTRLPGVSYEPRPAAYGVIRDARGRIAVVVTEAKHFLPGGGCRNRESPREGLVREVREECGRGVLIGAELGEAIQYFTAGDRHLELRATFFDAAFDDRGGHRAGEHALRWRDPASAGRLLYHECHAWAVAVSGASSGGR